MKKLLIAAVLGMLSVSSVAGMDDSYQCSDAYKRTNAARFHYEKIQAQVISANGVLKDSKIYCHVSANLISRTQNSISSFVDDEFFVLETGWVKRRMSESDVKDILTHSNK